MCTQPGQSRTLCAHHFSCGSDSESADVKEGWASEAQPGKAGRQLMPIPTPLGAAGTPAAQAETLASKQHTVQGHFRPVWMPTRLPHLPTPESPMYTQPHLWPKPHIWSLLRACGSPASLSWTRQVPPPLGRKALPLFTSSLLHSYCLTSIPVPYGRQR